MGLQYVATPLGCLRLRSENDALIESQFEPFQKLPAAPDAVTLNAAQELRAFFQQRWRRFTVPLRPKGTEFQQAVWMAMSQIPYGRVVSYGALAAAIKRPDACRAVGQAVGRNPLLIFLPCHRVVAAGGLGGFSPGTDRKRALLLLEGVNFSGKSTVSEKNFFTFL